MKDRSRSPCQRIGLRNQLVNYSTINYLTNVFGKDVLGQNKFLKSLLIKIVGLISYPGINWINKVKGQGAEVIRTLPERNVLFISNHQTYFADVVVIYHSIMAARMGRPNNTRFPGFLFKLKRNMYFVAAEETMSSGFLPKLFRGGGAIQVSRTWRKDGKPTKREVRSSDTDQIKLALNDGWVLTFPQGTTSPFVPGRKGTAHIIKELRPIVVPVVIDGFRRAFNKTGLRFKKRKSVLNVRFKEPLEYDFNAPIDDIVKALMDAIEQSEEFLKVKDV